MTLTLRNIDRIQDAINTAKFMREHADGVAWRQFTEFIKECRAELLIEVEIERVLRNEDQENWYVG